MIGPRLPEDVLAAHAFEAAENILQRIVERVAHMERTRHIRRRDDNRERRCVFAFRTAGFKRAFLFPHVANAGFDCCRIEPIVHHDMIILAGIGPIARNEGARKRSMGGVSTPQAGNSPQAGLAFACYPLDFSFHKPLNNARQIGVKPLPQNRTQGGLDD